MSTQAARRVLREVKPILSVDHEEARIRVLNLYKAWYRQIPYIGLYSDYKITSIYVIFLQSIHIIYPKILSNVDRN